MSDLWPEDIQSVKALAPVTIVREQGAALGKKTKNIIIGKVREYPMTRGRFSFIFVVSSPALKYEYDLFRFDYGVELYPVDVSPDSAIASELSKSVVPLGRGDDDDVSFPAAPHRIVPGLTVFRSTNEEEFQDLLRKIFASGKCRQVITALMAQIER